MKRRNPLGPPPVAAAAPGGWAPPAGAPETDGHIVYDRTSQPYRTRPVRPGVQLALRIGLWAAVTVGCIGGVLGVVTRPPTEVRQVADRGQGDAIVPAPVAGVAELAVQAWLTAGSTDDEVLGELFVEPVEPARSSNESLLLHQVTTVAGERLIDGFWSVTVAAEVSELPPTAAGQAQDPLSDEDLPEEPAVESTWFVEVAIVGDDQGGAAALTTPAILPGLPAVEDGWRSTVASSDRVGEDDPLRATLAGFLSALLAGDGDPSRYLAPGEEVVTAAPMPFAAFEVRNAVVDDLGDGTTRALVEGAGTTPGGTVTPVAYEVMLTRRDGRWEVVGFSGAPSHVAPPTDDTEPSDGSEPPDGTERTDETRPTEEPASSRGQG